MYLITVRTTMNIRTMPSSLEEHEDPFWACETTEIPITNTYFLDDDEFTPGDEVAIREAIDRIWGTDLTQDEKSQILLTMRFTGNSLTHTQSNSYHPPPTYTRKDFADLSKAEILIWTQEHRLSDHINSNMTKSVILEKIESLRIRKHQT